eukprot:TRINITY_DN570_c0_g2_i1.p1 TRINITY_DN570_c0_g2~~TRINITY_DN570_c0_g2_i1.p1  ORF type:complete len:447 (+),score=134.10 TRINITY_DN570_c0_g2_i1:50-1342(+)
MCAAASAAEELKDAMRSGELQRAAVLCEQVAQALAAGPAGADLEAGLSLLLKASTLSTRQLAPPAQRAVLTVSRVLPEAAVPALVAKLASATTARARAALCTLLAEVLRGGEQSMWDLFSDSPKRAALLSAAAAAAGAGARAEACGAVRALADAMGACVWDEWEECGAAPAVVAAARATKKAARSASSAEAASMATTRRTLRAKAAAALRQEKRAEAAEKEPDTAAADDAERLLAFWRRERDADCVCGCSRVSVDRMLGWRGRYDVLESRHHWIQWLFAKPGPKGIAAALAPALTDEAAGEMARDEAIRERFGLAIDMVLDFWGLRRGPCGIGSTDGCEERWANVARNPHNLLRISRVLQSLRCLGQHHRPWRVLCASLAEHFCRLAAEEKLGPEAKDAAVEFWAPGKFGAGDPHAACGELNGCDAPSQP